MQTIIKFTQILNLNIKDKDDKDKKIESYINSMGGPQNVLNYFLKHIRFINSNYIKDVDAELIKQNEIEDKQKDKK